jgi:hypothetical protein
MPGARGSVANASQIATANETDIGPYQKAKRANVASWVV